MTRARVRAVAAALLICGLFALPAAAQSGPNCGPHAQVLAGLLRGYGKVPVSMGLGTNNTVVETTANPATATWTIIVTTPDGPTCLVASGQSFELIPPPIPDVPG